jgi:regulatory protein
MATITALKYQKHDADRLNVYLDGEFAFGLAAAVASRLTIGQTLSPSEIVILLQQDDVEKAKKSAIQLISRRPRSVFEIERHLQKKGYEDQVIDQVTEHLTSIDLLNDTIFTGYWLEQREAFRPRSNLALRQELNQKGIDRAVIDAALNDIDEEISARRIAEKQAARWAHLPEEEFRVKLGRFLQQRGFPYDVINTTTNDIWQTLNGDQDLDYELPDFEGDK